VIINGSLFIYTNSVHIKLLKAKCLINYSIITVLNLLDLRSNHKIFLGKVNLEETT